MTGHLIDTFSLEEWFAVAHSCLRGFSQWSNVSDSGTARRLGIMADGSQGRKELAHSSQETEHKPVLASFSFVPPSPQVRVGLPSQ